LKFLLELDFRLKMAEVFKKKPPFDRLKRTFSVEKELIPGEKDRARDSDKASIRESIYGGSSTNQAKSNRDSVLFREPNLKEIKESEVDFEQIYKIFEAKDFIADQYIKERLSNNTEQNVRNHFSNLKDVAYRSSLELQKNVHKNYNEFIKTSKAISIMETDMLTVKALLNELRTVSQDLNETRIEEEIEEVSESKDGAEVESKEMQLLRQQRKQEMAKLIVSIEGIQPYLEDADRYHNMEGDLVELDPNDFHSAKVVHLNLFNDAILISSVRKVQKTTKKKAGPGLLQPNKLVADRFFLLKDIVVVKIRDSEELRNAFKLMKNADSYVFKATGKEDKSKWTSAITEAIESQLKVQKTVPIPIAPTPSIEVDGSDSEEDEGNVVSRGKKILSAFFVDPIGERRKRHPKQSESEKSQNPPASLKRSKSLRDKIEIQKDLEEVKKKEQEKQQETIVVNPFLIKQLNEASDELDVFIAQRQFDEAILLVEQANKLLVQLPPQSNEYHVFNKRIESQAMKLAENIGQDLKNPLSTKFQVKEHIQRMMKLGLTEQAREIFLSTRTVVIKSKIRKLKFEGEIYTYIRKLSHVVFTLLKNTCIWYKSFFEEPGLSSGFVRWICHEISDYCATFRRHVFQNQNFQITIDCLRVSAESCSILRQVGFDFLFLIEEYFHKDVVETIQGYQSRTESLIAKYVTLDQWGKLVQLPAVFGETSKDVEGRQVTESAFHFHQTVMSFLEDMESFFSMELYEAIIGAHSSFFEKYVRLLFEVSSTKSLNDELQLNLMCDIVYINEYFLPKVNSYMEERFNRSIQQHLKLKSTLDSLQSMVCDTFCEQKSSGFYEGNLHFDVGQYKKKQWKPEEDFDSLLPSTFIIDAIEEVRKFGNDIKDKATKTAIFSSFLPQIFDHLIESDLWDQIGRFESAGFCQILIDIFFFAKACKNYLSNSILKNLSKKVQSAFLNWKDNNKDAMKQNVPSFDSFEQKGGNLYTLYSKKLGEL